MAVSINEPWCEQDFSEVELLAGFAPPIAPATDCEDASAFDSYRAIFNRFTRDWQDKSRAKNHLFSEHRAGLKPGFLAHTFTAGNQLFVARLEFVVPLAQLLLNFFGNEVNRGI